MNTRKKGFTLIEIIVSIALLAIISVSFLTIFSGSMVNISRTGRNSIVNYTAQESAERIIDDPLNAISINNSVNNGYDIKITFPIGGLFTVSGRKVEVPAYGTHTLTTFTIN